MKKEIITKNDEQMVSKNTVKRNTTLNDKLYNFNKHTRYARILN